MGLVSCMCLKEHDVLCVVLPNFANQTVHCFALPLTIALRGGVRSIAALVRPCLCPGARRIRPFSYLLVS